jgi:23S rRNA pseudouridine2605 synthase
VKVSGTPEEADLQKLRAGIILDRRKTLPAEIRPLPSGKRGESANRWYEVVLREGRRNQIRRMFAHIGHPVRKLRRVKIGNLTLGNLQPGQHRPLTPAEVRQLLKISESHERD